MFQELPGCLLEPSESIVIGIDYKGDEVYAGEEIGEHDGEIFLKEDAIDYMESVMGIIFREAEA